MRSRNTVQGWLEDQVRTRANDPKVFPKGGQNGRPNPTAAGPGRTPKRPRNNPETIPKPCGSANPPTTPNDPKMTSTNYQNNLLVIPREIILIIFWSFLGRFGVAGAFSSPQGFWIVLGFFLGRFGVLPGSAAIAFGRPFCHILGIFWGRWFRPSGRPCTGAPPSQFL